MSQVQPKEINVSGLSDAVLSPSSSLATPPVNNQVKKSSTSEYTSPKSLYVDNSAWLAPEIDNYENILNNARVGKLTKEYSERLIYLLYNEHFEDGFENGSDDLINEQMKINALATKQWLSTIFFENFDNSTIVTGILRLVGRFRFEKIGTTGLTIAAAAFAHKELGIVDYAIRAFERWSSVSHLPILKNVRVEEDWLNEYLQQVIKNIEEKYGIISTENK